MNFDILKADVLCLVVEAGTDPSMYPELPKGAAWRPVRGGQDVSTLRGFIAAPSDREAEAQIKKQGYCMAKFGEERFLRPA